MTELLVLGVGSPFGDDQLGWETINVLQALTTLHQYSSRLTLLSCDRPGVQLLELMKGASTVFIIDAVKTGAPMGSIHHFQNKEIEGLTSSLSSHAMGVAQAIELGRILNVLPTEIHLYGIEIGTLEFQFKMSKPILKAVNQLTVQIEKDILLILEK